ncbi:MAG TPA: PIG-L family deacetylase [Bryobacteraceae bacterium]|jgi:LmbE family N-acetylglucosaminyl deacetylase|nr:PIG-L family deacetylase [Bryobacteraceae bacterium]
MLKRFLALLFTSSAAVLLHADSFTAPAPDARFKVDLLVVVAHPDDETELGSYLAHAVFDEKKRVAVVFGTRGNGGGNAEGQEQAAALGAVREIEARKALAHFGIQDVWFLNGLDTPGQDVLDSLETWNHGDSLGRLVRLVRLTRPAVIVTWLPDWVAGENHGDHQAAGVIATEAFDMAGDPTAFGEQLATPRNREDIYNLTEGLRPWQPQKLYFVTDAAHTDFVEGKGPAYTPGHRQAKLAAEECAYHLTQGDTGQDARAALAKGDLHAFEQPVRFIFGKSYVSSSVSDDLFAGVKQEGIAYRPAPGYSQKPATRAHIELGGPWLFYREFWQAHGLEHLAALLGPEILAKYASPFVIPVAIVNPGPEAITAELSVDLPAGWSFRRKLPSSIAVPSGQTVSVPFEVKTSASETSGWQMLRIKGQRTGGGDLGEIEMRVQLNSGAMPE